MRCKAAKCIPADSKPDLLSQVGSCTDYRRSPRTCWECIEAWRLVWESHRCLQNLCRFPWSKISYHLAGYVPRPCCREDLGESHPCKALTILEISLSQILNGNIEDYVFERPKRSKHRLRLCKLAIPVKHSNCLYDDEGASVVLSAQYQAKKTAMQQSMSSEDASGRHLTVCRCLPKIPFPISSSSKRFTTEGGLRWLRGMFRKALTSYSRLKSCTKRGSLRTSDLMPMERPQVNFH